MKTRSEMDHLEVVEGDRGVMWEEGAELVQACKNHKRHGVSLGCQGHHVRPAGSHHPAVRQQSMRPNQHLKADCCELNNDAR